MFYVDRNDFGYISYYSYVLVCGGCIEFYENVFQNILYFYMIVFVVKFYYREMNEIEVIDYFFLVMI